ncbi:MAG: SAM-dependent methyltransferase [Sedimentibacter sp.]|uniref:class I SAM-dependent methyltransferase n=1 Tax=Sedimentibacter sp. TaxID=1960295 RepID=UPI0031585B5F
MDNKSTISQTAMLIASLRALACYEDDIKIRGNDYMAEIFLPEEKRMPLKSSDIRKEIKKAIPEGLYEYVIARTKHFDDLFLSMVRQQIPQIVLLGAGYDSRAYRYASEIGSSKIFEVDMTATQKEKLKNLEDNKINIHPNVVHIEADFEQDGWFQNLYDAGYNNSLKTLYIWEGVTFYLSPKSVEMTLRMLHEHSLSGSKLSFDYQHIDDHNKLIETGLEEENIKFGLSSRECDEYLKVLGFSVIEIIDSSTMSERYLTMTNGSRFGEVKSIMNIVVAQSI